MNDLQRIPLSILVVCQVFILAMLLAGLLCLFSPFWISAGVFGWWDGYDRQADVLGIVWLGGSLLSIFLGIVLIVGAAIGALWFGLFAGIFAITATRTTKPADEQTTSANEPPSPSA